MKVYNSLTNKMEDFKPIKKDEISMYVCGPTVYNHMHIGNARPVVFFDTVRRFFEYIGYQVKMVSNFTDIDDKIIQKAIEENTTEDSISEKYIKAYLDACDKIGCNKQVIHPRVTEHIEDIILYIDRLVKTAHAYQSGDDVYFDVRSIPEYGILSNQKLDNLESGSRIDINKNKKDPADFTLWKKTNDIGKKWSSPFGMGRPGWHTECVVMIDKIFGGKIDIHGGGNDLKFPHHENEIAQSMALNNHTIANYWIHNARIDLSGEKMSKSLGNVIWLKDIIDVYPPQAYRLFVLSNHYRQTINYSDELMKKMTIEWEKFEKTYVSLYRKIELNDLEFNGNDLEIMKEFLNEMAYDFNTANALSVLYNLQKKINKDLRNTNCSLDELKDDFQTLQDMFDIFGLFVDIQPLSIKEKELVHAWQKAREKKDFVKADELRLKITEMDIKL
ncbi:MAG TPA: cysteine--tRNA ligase [Acholeplasmatales bacterium]|nr:cysteine--tRNA ligase [Acholeplasmatales bacterium]